MEVSAWGHLEAFTPLFLVQELAIADADIPRWTGLLAAASLVIAVPFSPFWGVLADRYNRKLLILRTLLIASVAYALAALCTDIWQLLGVRFLFGLTFAGNAIIVGLIALLAPERSIGLAIGLIQMVMPLGRSLGPLFGSWLIAQFGLRGMFAADAFLTGAAFVLLLLLLREPSQRRSATQNVLGQLGTVLGLVWRERPIRYLFILNFAGAMVNSMINPFVPVLITRVYGHLRQSDPGEGGRGRRVAEIRATAVRSAAGTTDRSPPRGGAARAGCLQARIKSAARENSAKCALLATRACHRGSGARISRISPARRRAQPGGPLGGAGRWPARAPPTRQRRGHPENRGGRLGCHPEGRACTSSHPSVAPPEAG